MINFQSFKIKFNALQRLNAAVHYTVGKICEQVGERNDMEFSRQFIAVLSEATTRYSQTMTQDAEMFAK